VSITAKQAVSVAKTNEGVPPILLVYIKQVAEGSFTQATSTDFQIPETTSKTDVGQPAYIVIFAGPNVGQLAYSNNVSEVAVVVSASLGTVMTSMTVDN
jgi:hypothetical protein